MDNDFDKISQILNSSINEDKKTTDYENIKSNT